MPYDVAIVGAGPAGSACAIHLARAGYQVALLDKASFPRHKACAEYLSPAAEPLLQRLGVEGFFDGIYPNKLRGFRITAPNGKTFQGDFSTTRNAEGKNLFESGLAISRYHLDATLIANARRVGVDVHENWRLSTLQRQNGLYQLHPVDAHESISAPLLIAADGLHSTVAHRLGLHIVSRMHKVAMVAHIRGITDLEDYGEMHVAGRRYVGLAPLESGISQPLCNVALVVDENRDRIGFAGQPESFLLQALKTFPGLHGRIDHLTVVVKADIEMSRNKNDQPRCTI
jgi:2-polyprenyl-6-methoxyphenol hydroxylase-like FAD-dependent oxidoreductase